MAFVTYRLPIAMCRNVEYSFYTDLNLGRLAVGDSIKCNIHTKRSPISRQGSVCFPCFFTPSSSSLDIVTAASTTSCRSKSLPVCGVRNWGNAECELIEMACMLKSTGSGRTRRGMVFVVTYIRDCVKGSDVLLHSWRVSAQRQLPKL